MFLVILLLCTTYSSIVVGDDTLTVIESELGRDIQVQNGDLESLSQTVANLKMVVAMQNKQIQDLRASDKQRDKSFEELRMTVGDLQKQCENKMTDTVGEPKQKLVVTGEIFDAHKHGVQTSSNNKETVVKRRQIREAENIAFTAYRDINIDHMAQGHTIKMNQVLLNDGSGFNNITGIFTVPISGVYLFNFHYNSHYRKTLLGLFVDGKNEVDAISVPKDSSQEMMGGNTAILKVTAGQNVWLEDIITDDGEIYSTPAARYATFSGVLLYDNIYP